MAGKGNKTELNVSFKRKKSETSPDSPSGTQEEKRRNLIDKSALIETTKTAIKQTLGNVDTLDLLTEQIVKNVINQLKLDFQTDIEAHEDRIRKLESGNMEFQCEINRLREINDKLALKQDEQEQYSRRNSVRIFNSKWKETQGEKIQNIVTNFFSTEEIELGLSDVDRCHRVGKKTRGPRAVLVKFTSYRAKATLMKKSKELRDKNIFVNEDLTNVRYKVLQKALKLKKEGVLTSVWTYDGRIHIRDRDVDWVSVVTSEKELGEAVVLDPQDTTVMQNSNQSMSMSYGHPPDLTCIHQSTPWASASQPSSPTSQMLSSTMMSGPGGTQIPRWDLGSLASEVDLPGAEQ